jgi:hypothetical protein
MHVTSLSVTRDTTRCSAEDEDACIGARDPDQGSGR